jgi:hypothetical protein
VFAAEHIHGDDTTVPVLAKGSTAPVGSADRFRGGAEVRRHFCAGALDQRLLTRTARSRAQQGYRAAGERSPRLDEAGRSKFSRHKEVAKAFDYMLKRIDACTRFLDDGRICLSNNAPERELRGIAMLESLCIPSSSVCKHWNRVVVSDATRATFSGHCRFDRFRRQVAGANLVWRAGHNLHRWQHAGLDQAADRVACDA